MSLINAEFERLHGLIEYQAEEVRKLILDKKNLEAELEQVKGENITLREQMAKDFQTIASLRIECKILKDEIYFNQGGN